MKKIYLRYLTGIILTGVLLALMTMFFGSGNVHASNGEKEATILFTHDLHSRLEPYQAKDEQTGETILVGGIARIKTEADRIKAEKKATFLVDAGDVPMGSLYQTLFSTHATELVTMGLAGYDATTFGNHDFDYGPEYLADMFYSAVRAREENPDLQLPEFVVSSIDWAKNTSEDNRMIGDALAAYGGKPYTVIERDGVRIGVFGVIGESADSNAPMSGFVFEEMIDVSTKMVKALQDEKVDMIVCLSHGGTNENPKESEDELLAEAVPEIDLIISGHTHTLLEEPIICGNTTIVSAGCYGKYLGEVGLKQKADGRWSVADYQLKRMDESVKRDETIEMYLKDYREIIEKTYLRDCGYKADQVLVNNTIDFDDPSDMYVPYEENVLGNLIADSYIYAIQKAEGEHYEPVAMAVVPLGVIRDRLLKGPVMVSDVFNVSSLGMGQDEIVGYPLVNVYLTGKELKAVAEIDATVSGLMEEAVLYPSGGKWVYNPSRLPFDKVVEVYMADTNGNVATPQDYKNNLVPVEDNKLYRVVSGLYSAQMLGAVKGLSYNIVDITLKDKNGNPIQDLNECIIHTPNGAEIKEWLALAEYVESFEKGSDGIAVMDSRYALAEGRKEISTETGIVAFFENPSSFAKKVYVVILVLFIVVFLMTVLIVRRIKRNRQMKQAKK